MPQKQMSRPAGARPGGVYTQILRGAPYTLLAYVRSSTRPAATPGRGSTHGEAGASGSTRMELFMSGESRSIADAGRSASTGGRNRCGLSGSGCGLTESGVAVPEIGLNQYQ